jgi:protein-disulfide isomerase
MPNHPNRRDLMATAAAAAALALMPAAALAEPVMGDVVLGDPNAKVTVVEYASFTCPHCAAFHVNTWPDFKANYVDTGKVRFILREVYFDRYGLWASMTARCGGEAGFYPMADQFLKKQKAWTGVPAEQIGGEIAKIGRLNGLTAEQVNACLGDQEYARKLIEAYQANAAADGVTSTPTFLINGEKHSGAMAYDEFVKLVDPLL